jgi:hypothetical protein
MEEAASNNAENYFFSNGGFGKLLGSNSSSQAPALRVQAPCRFLKLVSFLQTRCFIQR